MSTEATAGGNGSENQVLLLKTKSTPNDGYEEYFTAKEPFKPVFVPVLEHKPNRSNLAFVKELLRRGDIDVGKEGAKYGGLIFTSQRAVEGFISVVEELRREPLPVSGSVNLTRRKSEVLVGSNDFQASTSAPDYVVPRGTPLYTVGPATSRALTSITSLPPGCIHGADTGNGEKLAYYILEHYNSLPRSRNQPKPPLLFLVGEQRRDIIAKTLTSEKLSKDQIIQVDELVVYETGVMESFEENFRTVLAASEHLRIQWVVVFSPTGCNAMLRCLGRLDSALSNAKDRGRQNEIFIATIGPTTRDYLINEFSIEPDACAEVPTPEGIMRAIEIFMASQYDGLP